MTVTRERGEKIGNRTQDISNNSITTYNEKKEHAFFPFQTFEYLHEHVINVL